MTFTIPTKTVKAYKLFNVDAKQPAKLFPLFVYADVPVEVGVWYEAKAGELVNGKVKAKSGTLAYRPGFHAGEYPIALHIGKRANVKDSKPSFRRDTQVWAEVEISADIAWQPEADKRGINKHGKLIQSRADITDQVPVGGYYKYKTNSTMEGTWIIGGAMRVNRVLSDDEVIALNIEGGKPDLPRVNKFDAEKYGFN